MSTHHPRLQALALALPALLFASCSSGGGEASLDGPSGGSSGLPSGGSLTVEVGNPPDGLQSAQYSHEATASGGIAPYSFSVSSGSLPPGLNLASTGQLQGVPSGNGLFSMEIQAQDSAAPAAFGSVPVQIFIAPLSSALIIANTTMPDGTVNSTYAERVFASGGSAPYTFSITGGALPPGLTLNTGTGHVTGTPTSAGSFTFDVDVTDSGSQTQTQRANQQFTLVVASQSSPPPSSGPKPTPQIAPSRTSGAAPLSVHFDATATTMTGVSRPFHDLDYHWDFGDAGSVQPTGIGAVAGHVFQEPGTYTVTLTVTGENGGSTKQVTITVTDPDALWSGQDTICFSTNSDFSGAPSGAQQITTSDFDNAINTHWAPGKRLLFKRGQTFQANQTVAIRTVGAPSTVGAFGNGTGQNSRGIYSNNPVISLSGISDFFFLNLYANDLRIQDLNFVDQTTTASFLSLLRRVDHLLVHRIQVTRFRYGIEFNNSVPFYYNEDHYQFPFLSQSEFLDIPSYSAFISGEGLCVLNNSFKNGSTTHLSRIGYAYKASIDSNEYDNPGGDRVCIKLHGGHPQDHAPFSPWTGLTCVVRNQAKWDTFYAFEIAAQTFKDEQVRDILVEANIFHATQQAEIALVLAGDHITVRNNVMWADPSTTRGAMILAVCQPRGPKSLSWGNLSVYNNTMYSAGDSYNRRHILQMDIAYPNTRCFNNLMEVPSNGTNTALHNNSNASAATTGNNEVNQGATFTNAGAQDFTLPAGSSAIGKGVHTNVPVFFDRARKARSGRNDAGAHQR